MKPCARCGEPVDDDFHLAQLRDDRPCYRAGCIQDTGGDTFDADELGLDPERNYD